LRFLHAADTHIDSPLTGLTAYPDAPVDMLRTATRRAFTNLCDEAIALAVDFMIIAGDLYDGNWKDFNTGIFFCKEMGRLQSVGIPVYVLYGNHDAESEMTKTLQMPDNVHVFKSGKDGTVFELPHLNVVLAGRSFKEAATTENLAENYPPPVPGKFNIGVLHTALEGKSAHPKYAPCQESQLHASGYQYWALGHVHEHAIMRGAATIVFPGNRQGRNVRETGPRGAVLITVDDDGACEVERLLVDVLRWHVLEADVSGCNDLDAVVLQVGRALEDIAQGCTAALPGAVRVRLTGRTPAHGELFGMERQLRQEILAQAARIGTDRLWIEKVVVATANPDDGEALAARADAVADLQTILMQAEHDADFMKALHEELMTVVTKTHSDLLHTVPYFKQIRENQLDALIAEVRPGLIAHIAKEN
jgi:exonuclease SbcD